MLIVFRGIDLRGFQQWTLGYLDTFKHALYWTMYQHGYDKEKNNIDPEKGNAANNYHLIAYISLMWKLLTSVLAEKVYALLSEKNKLPDEKKVRMADS